MKTKTLLMVALGLVIVGSGVGIYLQDLKHSESTYAAWKANRYNLSRFNKIMNYNERTNETNWRLMKDSIRQQYDSLIILRFRKEMDSIHPEVK